MITRISYSSAKPRTQPYEGRIRVFKTKVKVQTVRRSEGCTCVRRGKPLWDWVDADEYLANNVLSREVSDKIRAAMRPTVVTASLNNPTSLPNPRKHKYGR